MVVFWFVRIFFFSELNTAPNPPRPWLTNGCRCRIINQKHTCRVHPSSQFLFCLSTADTLTKSWHRRCISTCVSRRSFHDSRCKRAAGIHRRVRHGQRSALTFWGSERTAAPQSPAAGGNLFAWSPAGHFLTFCKADREEEEISRRKREVKRFWALKSLPYPFLLTFPQLLVFLQHLQDHFPFMLQQKGQI